MISGPSGSNILDFNNALKAAELKTYLGAGDHFDPTRRERVIAGLNACVESFIVWLFPAAIITPRNAKVGNIHGTAGTSLVIETRGGKVGVWKDFGDHGQKGGDLIGLYMAARRVGFSEALDDLADWVGQGTRPEVRYERERLTARAARVDRELGPQKGEWHYTDAAGTIIASVLRFEPDEGGKEYRPWDAVRRVWSNPPVRPLYNIPGVLAAQRIVFCEGEKAAQALIDQGYVATSVMGGSNSPLDQSDLEPLRGKDVLIWPDADEPGMAFAARLGAALAPVCASVALFTIPDNVEKGWDAADAVEEGLDLEALLAGPQACIEPVLPYFWFDEAEPDLDANDFVENLLTSTAMSVVYGPSNCGKTFFVLDLALHVAQGAPWRGLETDRGAVVYLSLEGAQGIRNRLAAFRMHHGINGRLPFIVMPKPVNLLDDAADVAAVIQLIEHAAGETRLPVRMVVIDTLSRAMAGGNENSSEDMTALIRNCDQIRAQTSAHICIVHHSGKDEAKGARGHSSLRAATDTEIEIKADPDRKISTVRIAKQRDLEPIETFAFVLESVELGTNARGKTVSSCIVTETEHDEAQPRATDGLSPKQEQALSCLIKVLDMAGEDHEGSETVPRTRVVALDHWKVRLRSTGVIDRTQDNLARSQFSKLRKALEKKGKIECWDGAVWISAP